MAGSVWNGNQVLQARNKNYVRYTRPNLRRRLGVCARFLAVRAGFFGSLRSKHVRVALNEDNS